MIYLLIGVLAFMSILVVLHMIYPLKELKPIDEQVYDETLRQIREVEAIRYMQADTEVAAEVHQLMHDKVINADDIPGVHQQLLAENLGLTISVINSDGER